MSSGDTSKNKATENSKRTETEESDSKGSEGGSSYDTNESMGNQNATPVKKPSSVARIVPAKPVQRPVSKVPSSSTASVSRPLKPAPPPSRLRKEERSSKAPAPSRREEEVYESDEDSRSSASSAGSSYSREKSQPLRVTRSERVNGPPSSSSSRPKKETKIRGRAYSDDESSGRSRSPSEPRKKKQPEAKKATGARVEDKPRFPTLSAKDLGTSNFYVIPKPSRAYVVVREPETMEVFDSVKKPSTAWCPVTTFVDEREAEMFCRGANEMAYKRGEFRTPFPERGYVYYEVRHCASNPIEAEKFADEMSEIFQKNRDAYNKRRMDEINERRGGYDRR